MSMMDNVSGMSPSGGGFRNLAMTMRLWGGGRRVEGGGGGGNYRGLSKRHYQNEAIHRANMEQIGINAQGQSLAQLLGAREVAHGATLAAGGAHPGAAGGEKSGAGLSGVTGPLASVQFGTLLGGSPFSGQTSMDLGSMHYGPPVAAKKEAAPRKPRTTKAKEPAAAPASQSTSKLWLPTNASSTGETTSYAPGGSTQIDLTSGAQSALENWKGQRDQANPQ